MQSTDKPPPRAQKKTLSAARAPDTTKLRRRRSSPAPRARRHRQSMDRACAETSAKVGRRRVASEAFPARERSSCPSAARSEPEWRNSRFERACALLEFLSSKQRARSSGRSRLKCRGVFALTSGGHVAQADGR